MEKILACRLSQIHSKETEKLDGPKSLIPSWDVLPKHGADELHLVRVQSARTMKLRRHLGVHP